MKRILNIAAITALLVFSASFQNAASAQDDEYYNDDNYQNYENDGGGDVSYQTFYDELSPHGRWIDNPEHGYVWVPNAGRDFRPYSTNGHWVYTNNYEWMWVSDYSWGWAPFHYGRWYHDPFYGWVWVPGYEWSPAWVAWRSGGDYYGWAPIRPGISISINFGFGSYNPPYDYWCFAPRRYITSPRIHDYYYDRSRNVTIINQTTIINNYNYGGRVWRTGPTRMEVERYAGRITPVRFRETSRPGRTQFRNNEVSVYRPRVQQDNTRRFAPRAVERYDRQARTNEVANNTIRNGRNDRTFDTRNSNGGTVRGNSNNVRRERNNDAPITRQNDNNLPSQQQRQFERRSIDRTSEAPAREQRREMRNMERPQQAPQQQQRSFEPRGNGQGQQRREMRTMERPPQAPQQQQRSFEPRSNGNGREGQQRREVRTMERSQPSQPVQQRQVERGGGNENRSQGNGGGNGNGRGRGRS